MTQEVDRLLRLREVVSIVGVSRATLYEMIRRGEFPAPVRIGARAVGWRQSEVQRWLASRPTATESNWR